MLTLAAFAVWWQIDSSRALWIVVALLVVTCPCALSLATPASALTLAVWSRHYPFAAGWLTASKTVGGNADAHTALNDRQQFSPRSSHHGNSDGICSTGITDGSAVSNAVLANRAADIALEVGCAQLGEAVRVPAVHERHFV